MTQEAIDELKLVLTNHQPQGFGKIQAKLDGVEQVDQKLFFYLFAICTRWFDTNTVDMSASSFWQEHDNFNVLPSWQWPSLARLYLLLFISQSNTRESYCDLYKALFNSSDVQESIVLIQSLAFVPHAEDFVGKAREAARSNIVTLFNAVAHNTSYAAKYFDESGWNQLILKAAFLSVPIVSINGLKDRNNQALVDMLCDYARERQVASRSVPWDLWCCVAWLASNEENYQYLREQFARGDVKTKAAIALGLIENEHEDAVTLGNELIKTNDLSPLTLPLDWEAVMSYEAH